MTAPRPIEVGIGAGGRLIYLVDLPPEALPSVRTQDLARAWDGAREAARARRWGVARGLRFRRGDGGFTHLSLEDRDAACWAAACDHIAGLHTGYGLALCLRLLALVDLLARAPWASPLLALRADGARLHPLLLRLAATAPLTSEARFDEQRFQAGLGHLAGRGDILTGACV